VASEAPRANPAGLSLLEPFRGSVSYHDPVLAAEILALARGARRAVDGTVGGGGHTRLLLEQGAAVLAVDRDPAALRHVRSGVGAGDVRLLEGGFADAHVLAEAGRFEPDFVLLDLGVSSRQLDDDARGFTFRAGASLDMRMGDTDATAADLLNSASPERLRTIFHDYGDERRARRLASVIVRRRAKEPFATSDHLVNAIREALGARSGPPDFARLFQAVRIAVNDELGQLTLALPVYRDVLPPGGRLAVISYHSGEDRIVKHAFRDWCRACVCPPRQPVCTCRGRSLGYLDPVRPVTPTVEEIAVNPRARSARLRGFVRDA
jgi:16S rRNA (cytosine1402-N4)-methyltransferase